MTLLRLMLVIRSERKDTRGEASAKHAFRGLSYMIAGRAERGPSRPTRDEIKIARVVSPIPRKEPPPPGIASDTLSAPPQ